MLLRRLVIAALPFALAMPAAQAALPQGAKAPPFSTPAAQAGKPFAFSLAKSLAKGPVVLYFFPKTFTQGCTIEAHEFAEKTPEFETFGATVIGMSADSIAELQRFSREACRDKFAVGIASRAMIKAYDVAMAVEPGRSERVSYVIAPDGRILYVHNDRDPRGHITGTLAAVKAWRAQHPAKRAKR
ncbi:peroxiredoxin [Sphingomonas sanxanigenens]|uniref:thioredoxin-dependent peroxiredoxin n=1 Tax=Sphingomonas sanxanigenens DSM 19645 = NX02 TaxID=1123269 RepID=W0A657_9SPHN|nr:peroxiredoxin [Sphingomonas sanxanigenens]AHE52516.1 hypothetical protein NX02_03810 [Sphingomonas sanxanigenens DSM 19645 = NX02]